MIQKICLFFIPFCFIAYSQMARDPGENLYPHIQKIDNELYFAKMKGQNLYFVMELVTSKNINAWKRFGELQSNPRMSDFLAQIKNSDGTPVLKGRIAEGANHFYTVLQEVPLGINEVWVAYITSNNQPQHIPLTMEMYTAKDIEDMKNPFASAIKMSVTVTSSPQALITSHMGISASAESIISKAHPKGISVPLHAFAAQVMLRRNPDRRYMVNAPVAAMEKILIDKMNPHTIFIGTREMRNEMMTRLHVSFKDFLAQKPKLEKDKLAKLEKTALEALPQFNEELERVNTATASPEDKKEYLDEVRKDAASKNLSINSEGLFSVDEAMIRTKVDEQLNHDFKWFKNPYTSLNGEQDSQDLLRFMTKYPPILSGNSGKYIDRSLTIYDPNDPDRPWLHVKKGDQSYQWIFTEPFQPAGKTHYIAVDLKALAEAAPVEPR